MSQQICDIFFARSLRQQITASRLFSINPMIVAVIVNDWLKLYLNGKVPSATKFARLVTALSQTPSECIVCLETFKTQPELCHECQAILCSSCCMRVTSCPKCRGAVKGSWRWMVPAKERSCSDPPSSGLRWRENFGDRIVSVQPDVQRIERELPHGVRRWRLRELSSPQHVQGAMGLVGHWYGLVPESDDEYADLPELHYRGAIVSDVNDLGLSRSGIVTDIGQSYAIRPMPYFPEPMNYSYTRVTGNPLPQQNWSELLDLPLATPDERDVEIVMAQANVARDGAIRALRTNNNDIINAILTAR